MTFILPSVLGQDDYHNIVQLTKHTFNKLGGFYRLGSALFVILFTCYAGRLRGRRVYNILVFNTVHEPPIVLGLYPSYFTLLPNRLQMKSVLKIFPSSGIRVQIILISVAPCNILQKIPFGKSSLTVLTTDWREMGAQGIYLPRPAHPLPAGG